MGALRCRCGAILVEDITEVGVRPVGGDKIIPFRRTTDYVVCEQCMRTYSMTALLERALSDADQDEPLPEPNGPPPVA